MSLQKGHAPEQAPQSVMYTLQELRIDGFAKGLGHLRKRYVTVRVDKREVWRYKSLAIRDDALAWKDPKDWKHFGGLPTSTLELKLFEAPLVGDKGKEIASCIHSVQSYLDSSEGQPWLLGSQKQKSTLKVTIIVVKNDTATPKADSAHDGPEMGKVTTEAQDELLTMNQPGEVPGLERTVDTIQSASEGVDDGSDTWQPLMDKVEGFMNLVDGIAEVHPYAKMAWSVISAAYKIYKAQKNRDAQVKGLADQMQTAYDTIMSGTTLTALVKRTGQTQAEEVQQADRRHTQVLQRLSIQTVECGQFIAKYAKDRNFFLRAGKQILLNPKMTIDRFADAFDKLQQEFMQQAVASTEIMTVRVLQTVQKLEITSDLSGLRSVYVTGAGYNTEKQCLPGTRTAALDEISKWINSMDDNAPQIRLLLGQAGTGKSTIAHTIASRFRNMKRLGAAFCFSSSAAQQSCHAFATLALDLASFDAAFKAALWNGVGQDLGEQTTSDLTRQFENFILKPSQDVAIVSSILIILEGLDEIGDVRARGPLLRVLSEHLRKLPKGFRVLLTARPESDIIALFEKPTSGVTLQYVESIQEDPTLRADIHLFIRTELTKEDLGTRHLDETHYEKLTARSEGLFQWARLACDYIIGDGKRGRRPRERYEDLMQPQEQPGSRGGKVNVLDDLYQRLLPRLIDLDDDEARSRFKRVMGIVLYAAEPLTMTTVQGLGRYVSDIDIEDVDVEAFDDDVHDILSNLGSLLSGVSDLHTPVQLLHSSFRDFLTIEFRSKKTVGSNTVVDCYIGDAATQHNNLATSCLRILNSQLHFNMCSLETSYRINRAVPDLAERVGHSISSELSYASRLWAQHVNRERGLATSSMTYLKQLLEMNFLFWVEVLSLLGALNSAGWALASVIPLIRIGDVKLADLATDELRFVQNQAYPISESAPHIYISALASAPDTSLVRQHYTGCYPQKPDICRGRADKWLWMHDILRGHSKAVSCVAFSTDGKRIVSGSQDKTIRIWDAETGTPFGTPVVGHSDTVHCVAFSPDGKRIVSGSVDNTVRIWDVESCMAVDIPWEGHTEWVLSAVFSPDGTRLVSGSDDSTIRIWDAATGRPVGTPLEGHSNTVYSVSFSPDGKRLVSGSEDKTIRVWDVESGALIGAMLEGHSDSVSSVAFSFDGKQIVSGSGDTTARIWDANTGTLIGVPLKGHTAWITSVAFSPNGRHVVSGSRDNTIRIWDAQNGTPIDAPLAGHSDWVLSVAFSRDGKRIVSGSADNTLRIWDAQIGIPLGTPFEEHIGTVECVAFSPDGKRIVSGSEDNTIRMWDAGSGIPVGTSLEGHTNSIYSVAFSPNGRQLVSGSGDTTIRIWDVQNGTPVCAPLEGHSDSIYSVSFSPDGKRIVSGSGDMSIRIWDAGTGTSACAVLQGHSGPVFSVAFSPDGTRIVSGSGDNMIRLWDAERGTPLGAPLEGHSDSVYSVAFSPDGKRIVSSSGDTGIRIWDMTSGTPVSTLLWGHVDAVYSAAFSPDGKQIVSGSGDRTVRIWNEESGIYTDSPWRGHTGKVRAVAFTPDGMRIVSASEDRTIRLWDTESGTTIIAPMEYNFFRSVAMSLDGRRIISVDEDGTREAWDAETGESLETAVEVEGVSPLDFSPPVFTGDSKWVVSSLRDGLFRIFRRETLLSAVSFCPDIAHRPVQPCLSPTGDPVLVSLDPTTGWATCNWSDHLFWLPPEQVKYLCTPGCRLVIPTSRMVTLDLSRFVHGERWTECCQPGP